MSFLNLNLYLCDYKHEQHIWNTSFTLAVALGIVDACVRIHTLAPGRDRLLLRQSTCICCKYHIFPCNFTTKFN